MRTIDINSPEHRALIIETITKKNFYLLQQLYEASKSDCSEMVVLESFYDLLKYTSSAKIGERYEAFTDASILRFGPNANGELF